ncbi:Ig-like domain-containing protein [Shewanella algae]|uniref:Ig-like domain-containing protein n=1 Tax=Shewanella algae TaxID=38313 RepID=UPI002719C8D7|nr:Ig-like domain-containing protein [Shewanella algae]MDO8254553.1 Ig-like domain-containing protein [Shewanella algae]HEW9974317.1 tandem-95 repeat protein [Shewanella algae]
MKHTLWAAGLTAMLLTACGSDKDTGLLDLPEKSASLTAAPLTVQMKVNDIKTIDLTDAVTAVNIAQWSLSGVQDAGGLGVIDNLQSHTFDYQALATGVTTLPYNVSGGGKSASSVVLVAVEGQPDDNNQPPVALNVTAKTKSNQALDIDLSRYISDADGDSLSIEHLASHSGRFVLTGEYQVTFTPGGFVGVDSAAYSVSDGRGGYDVAYIAVTSEDANPSKPSTPPTAKDISRNINSTLTPVWSLDLLASNDISGADGDTLTIVRVFADNNRVTFEDTTLTYTPGDFVGVDQFTYVVSNGWGDYAVGTVTLTVSKLEESNTPPQAMPLEVSGVMDNAPQAIRIDLSNYVSDADNDALRLVTVVGGNGTASLVDGSPLEVDYRVPTPPQGLRDSFSYVVTDDKGGYAMSTVTINMVAHNANAPVATIAQLTTRHDQVLQINLDNYISDVETANADLTVSNLQIKNAPAGHPATASLTGKNVTYSPNGFVGVDILTYVVSDGELSTEGIVVITVNEDGSHSLIAQDIYLSIDLASNGTAAVTIPWEDKVISGAVDGLDFTLVNAVGASLGSASVANNTLRYIPTIGKFGTDKFVYTVKDSHSPAHYAQGLVTVELVLPAGPTISALSIGGSPTIASVLTANVSCDTCDSALYQYKWVINGLTVGTGASYTFRIEDIGFNIRLEVFGEDAFGQTTQEYVTAKVSRVGKIYGNNGAFAAMLGDGSVMTWGGAIFGGDSSAVAGQLSSGVSKIYTGGMSFAALKDDGSVVTWGDPDSGGDSSSVAGQLSSGVSDIYANWMGFAALKEDGSVVTWGQPGYGGDSSAVAGQLSSGVKMVYANHGAFAALKEDGSVVTWGHPLYTGDISLVAGQLSAGVKIVYPSGHAFAAMKDDGSIVTWGYPDYGGDSSAVAGQLSAGVKTIYGTDRAFAALMLDGSVVTWGYSPWGGDSSAVASQLSAGVREVYSTSSGNFSGAFAALKEDGSVVTWGTPEQGGDSSAVAAQLTTGVKVIYPSRGAFAAVKGDGSVVTWGAPEYGGDSSAVAGQLSSGVSQIYSYITGSAYAAVKEDGSVVTWGHQHGGDSSAVANQLSSDVSTIYSAAGAFAAVKTDGSVVAWGYGYGGGFIEADKALALAPALEPIESSIGG